MNKVEEIRQLMQPKHCDEVVITNIILELHYNSIADKFAITSGKERQNIFIETIKLGDPLVGTGKYYIVVDLKYLTNPKDGFIDQVIITYGSRDGQVEKFNDIRFLHSGDFEIRDDLKSFCKNFIKDIQVKNYKKNETTDTPE